MNLRNFLVETLLSEAYIDNVKIANPDIDPSIIDTYHDASLPKGDKSQLDWVVKQHRLGNITPEYADTLHPYITSYQKNKALIGDNINKFDVDGLRDAVKRFHAKDQTALSNDTKNTKVIHEDDDIIIHHHKGWESTAAMGKLPPNNPYHKQLNGHARWCISLRGGVNKPYLSTYTDGGKHPVVAITNKHTGRKYALVMSKGKGYPEFRDEHDARPDNRKFLSENPTIMNTKVGKYLHDNFEDARDYMDRLGGKKLDSLSGDDISKLYHDNSDDRVFQDGLMSHKNISPELLHQDYMNRTQKTGNWDKGNFPSLSNKKFPSHVLDSEIDNGIKNRGDYLSNIALHAHLKSHHIDKLLDYSSKHNSDDDYDFENAHAVTDNLLDNDNIKLTSDHFHNLINQTGGSHLDKIYNKTNDSDIIRKAYNKDGSRMIYDKTIGHILDNKHTPSDVLADLAHNNSEIREPNLINGFIHHKNTDEALNHIVDNNIKFGGNLPLQNMLRNSKLSVSTQMKLATHLEKHEPNMLSSLVKNPHLDAKTVNHLYSVDYSNKQHLDQKPVNHSYSVDYSNKQHLFDNDNFDKLNDTNINHFLNIEPNEDFRNPHELGLQYTDFTKRPKLFDKYMQKKTGWYAGSGNETLTSDMIDKLHGLNKWDEETYLKHPNTSDTLVNKIYDRNKLNKTKVLDRPVISKGVTDHILKTSLEPIDNRMNTNYIPTIKKLINHDSANDYTYGKILKAINYKGIIDNSDNYRKDLLHEVAKNSDKLSNRNYNSLVSSKLHDKTFDDLLRHGHLTGEQLHNLVVNNKNRFGTMKAIHTYADRKIVGEPRKIISTEHVFEPKPDILEKVLKHPALEVKTLDHMISNDKDDKYIDDKHMNYAHRLLQEKQGQLSLPIKFK